MSHTNLVLGLWQSLDALICGKGSKPFILSGHSLSISEIICSSLYYGDFEIGEDALQSMSRSLSLLEEGIRKGHVIYGVNTGFGGSADVRTKKVAELQQALIRELHYGILPPGKRDHQTAIEESSMSRYRHDVDSNCDGLYLPHSWARASILIRINSLISGCSAARPVIVERMRDLLYHDIVPMIPVRGSISASGDLSPLSYICGAIQGKSTIRIISKNSEHLYADTALAHAGLEPVELQAKEGLATYVSLLTDAPVTNGTAISTAAAALAIYDTHGLAIIAQVLTAMSVEALHGTTESFDSFFSLHRPHPGQTECAHNIMNFLSGSQLTKVNDGADSALRQDRYSIRTAPQWLGPVLEDLVLAHQQVSIECNSATDNPLVTPEGHFLHGGNFQAKAITSAMEKTRQATQSIGRMLFSQCTEIINPATNRGLPPNLVAEDPSISLIFKGTDLHIASLTAELGFLANPVNHVQTAEMGNQSLNSLALISARYTHMANEVLAQLCACHLVAVCQALDLRAMQAEFFETYRSQFEALVAQHYPVGDSVKPAQSSTAVLAAREVSRGFHDFLNSDAPGTLGEEKDSGHVAGKLSEALWAQLVHLFGTTASMDASGRFHFIAKSLRPIILDTLSLNQDPKFVGRLEDFTDALGSSLREAWCAHRDAYLVHGDATPILGEASKVMHTFVRQTLKVPMMATHNLKTPESNELLEESGTAPTVGSYTGAVYRALRDGTLFKVAMDLVHSCVPQESDER
ncbi:hypothetical protein PG995_006098 [Apiospora arundinis]